MVNILQRKQSCAQLKLVLKTQLDFHFKEWAFVLDGIQYLMHTNKNQRITISIICNILSICNFSYNLFFLRQFRQFDALE